MASPKLVVESAVHQFLRHWNDGLCPTLSLKTRANGDIDISFMMSVSPFSQQQEAPFVSRSKRSGYGSRLRRKERRRNKTQAEIINCSDEEGTNVESCTFNNKAFETIMESASSVVELEASQSNSKQINNSLVNLDLNIDDHYMKSTSVSDDEDIVSAVYEKSTPASSSPNQVTSMMNSRQQVFTPVTKKDTQASTIFQGLSLPSDPRFQPKDLLLKILIALYPRSIVSLEADYYHRLFHHCFSFYYLLIILYYFLIFHFDFFQFYLDLFLSNG